MAFPTIPTAAGNTLLSSTTSTASTTHTFPNLTTLAPSAGDLIIAICVQYEGGSANAEFSNWGASLTETIDDATVTALDMAVGVAHKVATGSESGTFTVTSAHSFRSVNFLMRIPAATWHGTTIPEVVGAIRATGAVANAASLNPAAWDAEDTLWITVYGHSETTTTGSPPIITTPPTNFSGELIVARAGDAVGHITAAVAFRQQNEAAEDAGAWAVSNATRGNGIATTIAVRPAPAQPVNADALDLTWDMAAGVNATAATLKWDLGSLYALAVLADTPLLYWRSGEPSGTVLDSSGNNRTGTAHGTTTRDVAGALKLSEDDGAIDYITDAYVDASYNPFTGQKTFEAWVKSRNYAGGSANKCIIGGLNTNPQFVIARTTGNVAFTFDGLTQSTWNAAWVGLDDQWVHVVVCFDDNPAGLASKLYLNGVDQGAAGGSHGAYGVTGNFAVGARGATPAAFFNGQIDEVAVYDGFLSSTRVQAHYDAATPRPVDGAAQTLKWDLNAEADADPLDLIWDLAGEAATTPVDADPLDLVWDIRNSVDGAIETLLWDVIARVTAAAETLKWDLATTVDAAARTLKWDLSGGQYWDAVKALGSGVKLYWRLGEAAGATVGDSSGSNNTGTAAGSYTRNVTGLAPEPDKAISLEGASDASSGGYVTADSYAPFPPNAQRTVSMMLRVESDQSHMVNLFCDYNSSVNNDSMVLEITPTLNHVRWYGDVGAQFPSYNDWPYQFVVGEKYHLILRIDDTASTLADQLCLFINGEKIGPPTLGNANVWHFHTGTTRPFQFGRRDGGTNTEYIDATVDEVFIYEGLITDQQASDLWSAAGFTSVNAQPRAFVWDVRASVDADALDLKWDTQTSIDATAQTLKWDVVAQVNATAGTLKWDLASTVDGIVLDLDWDMETVGAVNGNPATLQWDVSAAIDATARALKWDLSAAIDGSASALKWDLASTVDASERVLKWDLAGAIDASARTIVWDLAGEVELAQTLTWDLASEANAAALTAKWDLAAAVERALTMISDLNAEANGGVLDLIWDVPNAIDGTILDLIWDVEVQAGAVNATPLRLLWDIGGLVPIDGNALGLMWDTRSAIDASTRALKWDVSAEVASDALDLLWDVRAGMSADEARLLWDVFAAIDRAQTLKWDLAAEVARSLTTKWDVRTLVDGGELDLAWDMQAAVAAALTLIWELSGEASPIDANELRLVWVLLAPTTRFARITFATHGVEDRPDTAMSIAARTTMLAVVGARLTALNGSTRLTHGAINGKMSDGEIAEVETAMVATRTETEIT